MYTFFSRTRHHDISFFKSGFVETKADTLKQLRPIGKGDQELEKRLDQKELT
jgi:hypothetical protein